MPRQQLTQLLPSQRKWFRQKLLHKTHPIWRPGAPHWSLNPRSNPPPPAQRQPQAQSRRPLEEPLTPPQLPQSRPRPNRPIKKCHQHHPPQPTRNCSNPTQRMRASRRWRVRPSRRRLRMLLPLAPRRRLLRDLSKKIPRRLQRIVISLRFLEGKLHRQRPALASPQASTLRKSKRSQIKLNWWII